MIEKVREELENLLYPELRPLGRQERARLLKKASETPLDFIEWLGILAALVIVAGVTRYGVLGLDLADRLAVALANFLIAVPLLVITAGPFLVRRKRRGLHTQLH